MMKITLRDSATLLDWNFVLMYNNTVDVLLITQGYVICMQQGMECFITILQLLLQLLIFIF
jgi:hypothetical protein